MNALTSAQDRELKATDRYIAVAAVRITVPIFICLLVFAALPVFNDRFSEAGRSPKKTDGHIIALCYASAMLALLSTSTAAVNILGVNWYLRVDNGDMAIAQVTFVPNRNAFYDIVLMVNDFIFLSTLITLVIALMTFVWNELEVEVGRKGILAAAVIGGVVWGYLLLYALTAFGSKDSWLACCLCLKEKPERPAGAQTGVVGNTAGNQ